MYRKAREKLLPDTFKEHFDKSKKILIHNQETLKSLNAPSSATEGEKALFSIIKSLVDNIYGDMQVTIRDSEALFVYHCVIREKIKHIHDKLEEHNIHFSDLQKSEKTMKWID